MSPLSVCYFGTYRRNYARNRTLIEALRQRGVRVTEVHHPLWRGPEDRVAAIQRGWFQPLFWCRLLGAYLRLFRKHLSAGQYDLMIVGYPGHLDVFFARALTFLSQKPLVWDVLNSLYLMSTERGLLRQRPVTAWVLRTVEKTALHIPNLLLVDTAVFGEWFQQSYSVPPSRLRVVPLGVDNSLFHRGPSLKKTRRETEVLYYGTFIPNHGVALILRAAQCLSDTDNIHFTLIGDGPEREAAQIMATRQGLTNVSFEGWLELSTLVERVSQADILLGTFGNTTQAKLTNNNKVLEALALAKPLITGASPALPPQLVHGENVYLCQRGDAQALAEAITALAHQPDLRRRLAEKGYQTFRDHFTPVQIGAVLVHHLEELLNGGD